MYRITVYILRPSNKNSNVFRSAQEDAQLSSQVIHDQADIGFISNWYKNGYQLPVPVFGTG